MSTRQKYKITKIFMNWNFHKSWIEISKNHELKFYKNIKNLYINIKIIYKFNYNVMHHKFVRDKILGILYSADLKKSKNGWFQKN